MAPVLQNDLNNLWVHEFKVLPSPISNCDIWSFRPRILNSITDLLKVNNEIQWLFDCLILFLFYFMIFVSSLFLHHLYLFSLTYFSSLNCPTVVLSVCLQLILFFCDYQPLARRSMYVSALSQTNRQTYGCQHWAKSGDRDSFLG